MKHFLSIAMLAIATAAHAAAIILVHGAFADASSWSKLTPILEHDGYSVTAVQIPLTSLPDDIATLKRALEGQKGSVVLVGHSYGGAVITGAAASNPKVKSLVYVAAFAPDANEPLAALGYGRCVVPRITAAATRAVPALPRRLKAAAVPPRSKVAVMPRRAGSRIGWRDRINEC
jgi:pimeloyl-ACP methyl ester carboxylesterase